MRSAEQKTRPGSFIAIVVVLLACLCQPALAQPGRGLGPRLGLSQGPDEVFLGLQLETRPVLGPASFAPSLDIGLGSTNVVTANIDLRWYLLPLPDTGITFYGGAGPAWTISP